MAGMGDGEKFGVNENDADCFGEWQVSRVRRRRGFDEEVLEQGQSGTAGAQYRPA